MKKQEDKTTTVKSNQLARLCKISIQITIALMIVITLLILRSMMRTLFPSNNDSAIRSLAKDYERSAPIEPIENEIECIVVNPKVDCSLVNGVETCRALVSYTTPMALIVTKSTYTTFTGNTQYGSYSPNSIVPCYIDSTGNRVSYVKYSKRQPIEFNNLKNNKRSFFTLIFIVTSCLIIASIGIGLCVSGTCAFCTTGACLACVHYMKKHFTKKKEESMKPVKKEEKSE